MKISEFERKYGFVSFNKKDFILKELMQPTGKLLSDNTIEMAANALDDDENEYMVYWKCTERELKDPNYDKVDRVETK